MHREAYFSLICHFKPIYSLNFLAHMYLSCSDEELLVGNFLGDFLKNKEVSLLSPGIQRGIQLHRAIDHFTDGHPSVKACTKLVHNSLGKYAPVALDIYFDYVLYRHWDRYGGLSFTELEPYVYDCLRRYFHVYPERVSHNIEKMVEGRFLSKYISLEGLEWTFKMVSRRTSFKSQLPDAVQHLRKRDEEIVQHFHDFFPAVIELAESYCT